jgi:para-aminobenzoate synthetase component 1
MFPLALPWAPPLEYAAPIVASGVDFTLLLSARSTHYSGATSLLAWQPLETVGGKSFEPLKRAFVREGHPLLDRWFGYLGYELYADTEHLPLGAPAPLTFPRASFQRYSHLLRFDHEQQKVEYFTHDNTAQPPSPLPLPPLPPAPAIAALTSSLTRKEYLAAVNHIGQEIRAGNVYQANLTRKFYGEFKEAPEGFALFRRLMEASPAPYSALMRHENRWILSSSPERFLTLTPEGKVTARPIKGTAPRGATPQEDEENRERLLHSVKDRAENLMIVDLMRNDLARCCEPGSVKVDRLFEVMTHPTLHHMDSTITGQKREEIATLELVKACFPPGSMTGAPKIRAIALCQQLEQLQRGVYSGALGWFGSDGSCDLSVVIRTLLLQENHFEFQVGGGIVYDSEPETEWRETLTKAKGIAAALGISTEALAAL